MKHVLSKLKKSVAIGLLLFAGMVSCFFIPAKNTSAHHASDCSDVYTPLSASVVSGVNNNKAAYVQVMNETGVPWEMLAAIHYRETNFSRTNPANGQGIFQFVNGDGGPYPAGPVSNEEFVRQLRFMANRVQNDYVNRGSVPRERRKLVPNETNIAIVKDTLFSYNGRAQAYINQAAHFGYNTASQPYEGSPYVMNRFDCPRARMGIITRDYAAGIDSNDTRYGAFTVYARLKGDAYWHALTLPYGWQLVSQASYTNSSRTTAIGTNALKAGQRIYMVVRARNIGNTTWTKGGSNPVRLATANPGDRKSVFCDTSSWLSCNRPAGLTESSVAPGSVGTFEFWVKAPATFGNFNEYFNLLAEGKTWMNDIGMYWSFSVRGDTYTWQFHSQAVFANSARTNVVNPATLAPNTTYYVRVRAKNTGNTTWTNSGSNPLRLGTSNPIDRISNMKDGSWLSGNRAATLKEGSIAPGEVGTFEFSVKTPSGVGTYNEHFRPVAEGKAWLNDVGLYFSFGVKPPTYTWQYQSQAVYNDDQLQQKADINKVENKDRLYAVLKAKNTGNVTWKRGNLNLGTSNAIDRSSRFCDTEWLSCNRAATLKEANVAPGEVGTFEFSVTAPYALNGTAFNEHFRPVAEGKAWLNDVGLYYPFKMLSTKYAWGYMGQNIYSNSTRTTAANTNNLSRNTTYYLRLRARNVGGEIWQRGNLNLGTSNPLDRISNMRDSSWILGNRAATLQEGSVAPGEVGTFDFSIKTPGSSGNYNEHFRPVAENKAWLNDLGLYWNLVVN